VVTSVSPADQATEVAVDTLVKAVFSKAMNSASITASSFTLLNGSTAVAGAVTYDSTTKTATFTPSAKLAFSTVYTASLTTAIRDTSGYPLVSNYTWSFTTTSGVTMGKLYLIGFSPDTPLDIDSNGIIKNAAKLKTTDGKITLDITAGTKALNSSRSALSQLTAAVMASPPAAPTGNALIMAYTFGQEGATFDPPLTLSMSYDPTRLPQNVSEKDLYIALVSGTQLQPLQSTVDTQAKSVAVKVAGFSSYALLGKVTAPPPVQTTTPPPPPPVQTTTPPPPPPVQTTTPPPPTQTTTPPPVKPEEKGPPWGVIGGGIGGAIVVGGLAAWLLRRRWKKTH
jgi:hypothetical protein